MTIIGEVVFGRDVREVLREDDTLIETYIMRISQPYGKIIPCRRNHKYTNAMI